eukprot:TRINITY_DN18444_c0_g1_i1.p1 TRINITY_DN18444_c0_g1~~TRINITY_DN18444_c0_g1_i1.p1  ORF type:complete len:477 (-),score=79.30 TRINITY_DN18444_c0_g1_i1:20-1450(-)
MVDHDPLPVASPNDVMPVSLRGRVLTLLLAFVQTALTSGIIFGWPAFEHILLEFHLYENYCAPGEVLPCNDQLSRMNIIFNVGVIMNTFSPVVAGVFLDHFGPRLTNLVSGLIFLMGCLAFVIACFTGIDLYAVGYGLLGFSGPGVYVSLFHLSNMFPHHIGLVISCFSGIFTISSFIFRVFRIIFEQGVQLHIIFVGFAILLLPLLIAGAFIWPKKSYVKQEVSPSSVSSEKTPLLPADDTPSGAEVTTSVSRASSSVRSSEALLEAAGLSSLSLFAQMKSPLYWLCTIWIVVLAFPGLFLSAAADTLFTRADEEYLADVFNWIWSLGFVFVPVMGVVMDRLGLKFSIFLVTTMMLVYCTLAPLMLLHPVVAIVAFIFASLGNVSIWSILYTYMGKVFGFKNFGKLLGVTSFVIAGSSFLLTPLFVLTLGKFEGNFAKSNAIIFLASLLSIGLPLYYAFFLYRQRKRLMSIDINN